MKGQSGAVIQLVTITLREGADLMESLLDEWSSHREASPCYGKTIREGLSDVNIETHSSKFSFEAEENVLVNHNKFPHNLKKPRERIKVPKFPSRPIGRYGSEQWRRDRKREPNL